MSKNERTVGWVRAKEEGTPTLNSSASNQLGFASSPQPTKFWGFRSDTISASVMIFARDG